MMSEARWPDPAAQCTSGQIPHLFQHSLFKGNTLQKQIHSLLFCRNLAAKCTSYFYWSVSTYILRQHHIKILLSWTHFLDFFLNLSSCSFVSFTYFSYFYIFQFYSHRKEKFSYASVRKKWPDVLSCASESKWKCNWSNLAKHSHRC